jgi:uncharacterized protein (DUF58 family)
MADSLLEPEFLQRLECLYVVTREQFTGHVTAARVSRKFGVGLEFADYRAYTPGDDFRYIDWAAYAKRGDLLIKLFSEEVATQIFLVIDASLSMATGAPQKLLFAKKIAAAIGYIGLANGDPVSLVSFDRRLRDGGRNFQGRGQLQPLLRALDEMRPEESTSLGDSIKEFCQRYASKRGLVVLLSDFLDGPGYEAAIRLLHYHRFDLLAVRVNSRDEIDPKTVGDTELVDSETGERVVVGVTPAIVDAYRRRFEAHYAELARLCKVMRRGYVSVATDMPFESVVFDVFRQTGVLA